MSYFLVFLICKRDDVKRKIHISVYELHLIRIRKGKSRKETKSKLYKLTVVTATRVSQKVKGLFKKKKAHLL
jgi:hypothetical protein